MIQDFNFYNTKDPKGQKNYNLSLAVIIDAIHMIADV